MIFVLLDGEVSSALRCSGCARAHDTSTFALTIYFTLQVENLCATNGLQHSVAEHEVMKREAQNFVSLRRRRRALAMSAHRGIAYGYLTFSHYLSRPRLQSGTGG